jgi:hypothetical protein
MDRIIRSYLLRRSKRFQLFFNIRRILKDSLSYSTIRWNTFHVFSRYGKYFRVICRRLSKQSLLCCILHVCLNTVLRIRDVLPGSDFFPSRIPDPGFFPSRIPDPGSVRKYDPGCSSRIPDPGSGSWLFTHSWSQIQGSKRHRIPDPYPQHCLNTFIRFFKYS